MKDVPKVVPKLNRQFFPADNKREVCSQVQTSALLPSGRTASAGDRAKWCLRAQSPGFVIIGDEI